MYILGISAYYHDSAAALIKDGKVIAAAQEERFSRIKHDSTFPKNALAYCLQEEQISLSDISYISFYDKPLLKFERLLETYLSFSPRGIKSFLRSMPIWLKEKLFLRSVLKKELSKAFSVKMTELPELLFAEHHQSHAASAFYPSPFEEAAVLCLDGVGEWATTSVWIGKGKELRPVWEIDFPHSLGLLYSAFTSYLGFKVNSGEYKVMGLAPYGEPTYVDLILKHLIDLKDDGTFKLNIEYFDFATGLSMTNKKFHNLFNGPPRQPEAEITQRDMNIARSIQEVTELVVLKLTRAIYKELNIDNLCLAGGVALNCVANGKVLKDGTYKSIWIQPAAGDAGGAIGCALATWHHHLGHERDARNNNEDEMNGAFLGPKFSNHKIESYLKRIKANYKRLNDDVLFEELAKILEKENIVGWMQGRMEFGPRALGGRSILGDARGKKMQSIMNLKIKYRESFRPFAPSVLAEDVSQYFDIKQTSPYMLFVSEIKDEFKLQMNKKQKDLTGINKLKVPRSLLPAITHVDYSARIQTVHKETNPRYHALLRKFKERTGYGVLINTSFNVRGEPIVCDHEDAYKCFMRTEMDYLVLENFLLYKKDQPNWQNKDESWKNAFGLD